MINIIANLVVSDIEIAWVVVGIENVLVVVVCVVGRLHTTQCLRRLESAGCT